MEECYLTEESRLLTFKKFAPIKGAPLCVPEYFAKAGFYDVSSRKEPDLVQCFACGKSLGNWEEGDDPWLEHSKRGADCPFVQFRNKEGANFSDFLKLYLSVKRSAIHSVLEEAKKEINYLGLPLIEAAYE